MFRTSMRGSIFSMGDNSHGITGMKEQGRFPVAFLSVAEQERNGNNDNQKNALKSNKMGE